MVTHKELRRARTLLTVGATAALMAAALVAVGNGSALGLSHRLTPAQSAACASSGGATVSTAAELKSALADAQPGRTIHLLPGTYVGPFVATISGTQSAPISLCGTALSILRGTSVSTGYGFYLSGADWWQLDGFSVQTAQKGVVLDNADNDLLTNLDVHNIGDEGVHFRDFSSDNTISFSYIHATGRHAPTFGEGIYVGSAMSNWCSISGCSPDASNGNQVLNNTIQATTAENIDVKEGTTGGLISGNKLSGTSVSLAAGSAWVNVKGNNWMIRDNSGRTSPRDGFQIHRVLTGWGQNDVFASNVAVVNGPGYGYFVQKGIGDIVGCTNTASGAKSGLSNIACTSGT